MTNTIPAIHAGHIHHLNYHGLPIRVAATHQGPRVNLGELATMFRLPSPTELANRYGLTPCLTRFSAKGRPCLAISPQSVTLITPIPNEFTTWLANATQGNEFATPENLHAFPDNPSHRAKPAPRDPNGNRMLTTKELAELLSISVYAAREMCANRTIETVALTGPRGGVRYRVTPQAIHDYMNRNTITALRTHNA